MSTRWLSGPFVCLIFALLVCSACDPSEREARQLLFQATALLQDGEWVELMDLLNRVMSEYPNTDAATKAREMREQLLTQANLIAQTHLRNAFTAAVACALSYPDESLAFSMLEEFGFVENQDVDIEFIRSEPEDFLISAQHVVGDKVFSVGRDGNISEREI